MEKCRYYLSQVKFDGVTEETKDLATLIGAWFDENSTWLNAQKVYLESLKAPRNIFTKVTFDEKGNPIYSYDPKEDLVEETKQNFSYQWLPKQDYHNLILGKYCNCCAHIAGAGQGIMRASMILDTCQNLVIRNEVGEIIAKATIFINKQKGYGVFNTVETSFTYREQEDLKNIYQAFLRGTKAFIETYNKNYPENPITEITVGENRNTILPYLNKKQHPKTNVHPSLHYKNYALKENFYCYDGDCHTNQRLVLKK